MARTEIFHRLFDLVMIVGQVSSGINRLVHISGHLILYTSEMKCLVWSAALVLVAMFALTIWLRQLPTHSDEAKGHVEALQGLVKGLNDTLPPVEPIVKTRSKISAWSERGVNGKVSVKLSELEEAVKWMDESQNGLSNTKTSWVAAAAESKTHAKRLKEMIGDAVWPDQLKGVLRTMKDMLLLLGWPSALAALLLYLLHSDHARDRVEGLARSVQKVALPGGFEVTLWGDKFRQNQSETFKTFRADVQAEYDKLAERYTIKETLVRILKDTIDPEIIRIKNAPVSYRATIHVRDVLLKNSYYQLVDYLPTGGNRGRAWSVRFGMVGRAWRLEKNVWNSDVGNKPDMLMENWGMTSEEAAQQSQPTARHTMLCCILKTTAKEPVGAFYLDAQTSEAFGSDLEMAQLTTIIESAAVAAGLIDSLESIWKEIKQKAPLVEVYGNRN